MRIGCIVLAAGHSRRFGGTDKLTSLLGGVPLAEWILRRLPRDAFADIRVVVTSDAVKKICEEAGLCCVQYEGGQLSDSIRCGLSHLPEDLDGILFVNADRPFLREQTIRRMVETFGNTREAAARLYWQETPSNPILFPKSARQELLQLEGDKGGSSVLKSGKLRVVPVMAEDETETWDVDSPEALEKMNQTLLQRGQGLVYD